MNRNIMKNPVLIAAAALVFSASAVFCAAVMLNGGEEGLEAGSPAPADIASVHGGRPVIVIDAGHGGVDAGTSAADGTAEKDINLAIARKLEEIAGDYPVDVILTRRDGEELLEGYDGTGGRKLYDMESRRKIIEENNPDLVVLIHLNSYPNDTSVHGAQVFYPSGQTAEDGQGTDSREFAESVQQSLKESIEGSEGKEALAKDGIYLFENISYPIILVECGFLSNQAECERLKTDGYQQEIAEAIWNGINKKMILEPLNDIPLVESANR